MNETKNMNKTNKSNYKTLAKMGLGALVLGGAIFTSQTTLTANAETTVKSVISDKDSFKNGALIKEQNGHYVEVVNGDALKLVGVKKDLNEYKKGVVKTKVSISTNTKNNSNKASVNSNNTNAKTGSDKVLEVEEVKEGKTNTYKGKELVTNEKSESETKFETKTKTKENKTESIKAVEPKEEESKTEELLSKSVEKVEDLKEEVEDNTDSNTNSKTETEGKENKVTQVESKVEESDTPETVKETKEIEDVEEKDVNDNKTKEKVKVENIKEDSKTEVYVVETGDTLYGISLETDVSVEDLKHLNGLKSDLIYPNQVLVLTDNLGILDKIKAEDEEDTTVETLEQERTQKEIEESSQVIETEEVEDVYEVVDVESYEEPKQDTTLNNNNNNSNNNSNENNSYKPSKKTNVGNSNTSNFNGSYGVNYYTPGTCADWAFERRKQLGKGVSNMWGNGSVWGANSSANGYSVNNSPSVGAILQDNAGQGGAGAYGHVAIVESINGDGSITVSEQGWNGSTSVTYRTISASQVGSHNYIH